MSGIPEPLRDQIQAAHDRAVEYADGVWGSDPDTAPSRDARLITIYRHFIGALEDITGATLTPKDPE